MSLSYTLRESISGLTRTKLSSTISIVTICLSLLLLGLFGVFTINASRFLDSIRNKVELEAFLQEPLTAEAISDLARTITGFDGVEKVVFISKEEAAQVFRQEFGEDIYSVLDFNPLPPSFRISLRPSYRTAEGAQKLYEQLKGVRGIESIKYRRALLELMDRRTEAVNKATLGLGILISLSAILLVSNTIRLTIYAKRKLIRTMELVGATHAFIRLPFLLEGLLQGILGGLISSALLYGLLEYALRWVAPEFTDFAAMDPGFYGMVIAAGALLGVIGSAISVARFIRPAEGH
jgi:cell division transport system permease protein